MNEKKNHLNEIFQRKFYKEDKNSKNLGNKLKTNGKIAKGSFTFSNLFGKIKNEEKIHLLNNLLRIAVF